MLSNSGLIKFLNEQGKKLPYPILLRLYYTRDFLNKRNLEDAREKLRIPLMEELDISKIKKSDTIFILGSGSSINKISEERWRIISSHDSIGFNFWFCHKHIPSFYTFETIGTEVPEQLLGESGRNLSLNVQQAFYRETAKKEAEYAPVIKFVTDIMPSRIPFIEGLPSGFRENLYAVPIVSTFARNELEIAANISYLLNTDTFQPSFTIKKLFKSRASLSALITFAVKAGYQRIVLCGIDLNNSTYFYQDQEQYPSMASCPIFPSGKVHLTLKAIPFGIDLVIYELKRQVLDPRGIEIYVENRSSALFPKIPVAPDTLFKE